MCDSNALVSLRLDLKVPASARRALDRRAHPNLTPFSSSHLRSIRLKATKKTLEDISAHMVPSLSHVLNVLDTIPTIEDLELYIPLQYDISAVAQHSIILPSLTIFRYIGLSTSIPIIFNAIRAPRIQKLRITALACPGSVDEMDKDAAAIGDALRSHRAILGISIDEIRVTRSEKSETSVSFERSNTLKSFRFRWRCQHGAAADNLLAVLSGFCLHNITSLHLLSSENARECDNNGAGSWPKIFRMIPGVVVVTMTGQGDVWADYQWRWCEIWCGGF